MCTVLLVRARLDQAADLVARKADHWEIARHVLLEYSDLWQLVQDRTVTVESLDLTKLRKVIELRPA